MTQLFEVSPFLCAHWTKLFPTKKLQHQSIFDEESNRTAEDIIFLICLFFHASKLVWIPDIAYLWTKRTDSLSNNFYSNEHYFDYLKCVDLFYDAAKPRKRVDLAETFCNDYQGYYLSHLLLQVAHGKSTKNNAQKVIGEIARVCSKHGVQTRCPPKFKKISSSTQAFSCFGAPFQTIARP